MRKWLAALFAGAPVSGCAAAACGGEPEKQRAREGHVQEETARGERTGEATRNGSQERQRASYYGEGLAGNPTGSGEPYDLYGLTAAQSTLPFGTVLEVCYRGWARMTINDRNPRSAADLDLSHAAADRIGPTRTASARPAPT